MPCKCKPDGPASELATVTLHHLTSRGHATAGVDPCIAPLVQALNDGGLQTIASCCGHNQRPGWIALGDGRQIMVMPDMDAVRSIEQLWPDIHGNPLGPRREEVMHGGVLVPPDLVDGGGDDG